MENTNKNTSMTREDLKKQIYTKDGTVKTPDGREFGNLTSALKAYDLHINTFYERLDKGCSIREAFVGPDYKCGLKFDNDGFGRKRSAVIRGVGEFNDLEQYYYGN